MSDLHTAWRLVTSGLNAYATHGSLQERNYEAIGRMHALASAHFADQEHRTLFQAILDRCGPDDDERIRHMSDEEALELADMMVVLAEKTVSAAYEAAINRMPTTSSQS